MAKPYFGRPSTSPDGQGLFFRQNIKVAKKQSQSPDDQTKMKIPMKNIQFLAGRSPSPPSANQEETRMSRVSPHDKMAPKAKVIGSTSIKFIKAHSPDSHQVLTGTSRGSPKILNVIRKNGKENKSPTNNISVINDEADVNSDDENGSSNFKLMNQNNFNRPKIKLVGQGANTTRDRGDGAEGPRVVPRFSKSPTPQQITQGNDSQPKKEQKSQLAMDFIKKKVITTKQGQPVKQFGRFADKQKIQKTNFVSDMKKHGIHTAVNEVKNFNLLSDQSPEPVVEKRTSVHGENLNSRPSAQFGSRHFSPPPCPTSQQTKNTLIKQEPEDGNKPGENQYAFPFQRRARSHSSSKNAAINNKFAGNQAHSPVQNETSQERSGEPPKERRGQPVVAKTNFLLGRPENQLVVKHKEVEEWLMGSGESGDTLGSNREKQMLLEAAASKPVEQPGNIEDEWLFKTFVQSGDTKGTKISDMRQNKKEAKDSNPFDMAESESDDDFNIDGEDGCSELMQQMEAFSNPKQSLLK